jgi:hypothetical protein
VHGYLSVVGRAVALVVVVPWKVSEIQRRSFGKKKRRRKKSAKRR